jgi:predicted NAD/FAD-binding protein
MSFGVSIDQGRFEYAGSETLGALFAQKSNLLRPQFQRMLIDIMRFNKAARRFLSNGRNEAEVTIDEFLINGRFGSGFTHHYFLPMCAAIWSSSLDLMRSFPARSLLKFFDNHGLLNVYERPVWRTVTGGSRVYVEKLGASREGRIKTGCAATRVMRSGEEIIVVDGRGGRRHFDAVVLACHADQALRLMSAPTLAERQVLGSFHYQTNRAVLHRDRRLMPKRRDVWSSWNYLSQAAPAEQAAVSVTYWLNRLQAIDSADPVLLSLNPIVPPDEAKVLAHLTYEHPQFDLAALAAQARLKEIQGQDRIWFAGAYWGHGFHEDGLLSGLNVAAALGITAPWWSKAPPSRTPWRQPPAGVRALQPAALGGS